MKSILLFVGGAATGVVLAGVSTFVIASSAAFGVRKQAKELLASLDKDIKDAAAKATKKVNKTAKKPTVKKKASIFTKGKATAKAA